MFKPFGTDFKLASDKQNKSVYGTGFERSNEAGYSLDLGLIANIPKTCFYFRHLFGV